MLPLLNKAKTSVFSVMVIQNAIGLTHPYPPIFFCPENVLWKKTAQWLSGRVLDSRQKGRGFEPYRGHCVVVLEQDTFILA